MVSHKLTARVESVGGSPALMKSHSPDRQNAGHTEEQATRYMGLCIDSAHAFSTLPMPTIAAVNGACFGLGS